MLFGIAGQDDHPSDGGGPEPAMPMNQNLWVYMAFKESRRSSV